MTVEIMGSLIDSCISKSQYNVDEFVKICVNSWLKQKRWHYEKLKHRRAAQLKERKRRSEHIKAVLLDRGLPVFKKYGIRKAVLFGSVADGVCHDMSDIDILVMPLQNTQYWDFRHELEQAVDFPIDLYTNLDEPYLVNKILSRGDAIYDV